MYTNDHVCIALVYIVYVCQIKGILMPILVDEVASMYSCKSPLLDDQPGWDIFFGDFFYSQSNTTHFVSSPVLL